MLAEDDPPGGFCRRLSAAAAGRLGVLLSELTTTADDPERHNAGVAYALLSAWAAFREAPEEGEARAVTLHPAVERAARLLRDDPGADDGLEKLSARAGLSPARLSALFRAQVGVPLSAFRSRQRLDRFVSLWAERGASSTVLELALEAGFGSYAQFYRVFRREMGCGPAEFLARPAPSGGCARPSD